MFSEFVSQLSNAPESEWVASFKSLARSVENSGSSGKVPTKRDISQVFTLVESKLRTISGGSEELVSVLLDALRVLLRFRENVEASLTAQLMSHLLNISEGSAKTSVDNAQLAARCLINFLFDNAQNAVVFLSVEVDGLSRIVRILNSHCEWCHARTEEMSSLHYFLVRVVHMMVSQNDTVRALLTPSSELTLPLVVALIRRLSKTVSTINTDTDTTSGGVSVGDGSGGGDCSDSGSASTGTGSGSSGGIGSSGGGKSSGGGSGGTTKSTFPYGECNGKLYLEIGRLLFALECHEVLKTRNNSSGSGTSSGVGSNDSASVSTETGPLSRLLIVTVLSAILNSTTPYTTTTATNTSTTTANNTTNTPTNTATNTPTNTTNTTTTTTLTTLQQQCQDVSIQLAMYLPARSYHDSSVVAELSVLMSSNSNVSGGTSGSTSGSTCGGNSSTNTGSGSGTGTGTGTGAGTGGESKGESKRDDTSTNTNTTHEPAIVVQIVPYLLSILHRQLLQAHGESTDTNNSSSGGSNDSSSGGSGTSGSGSGGSGSGSGSGSGGGSVKSVKAGAAMKPSEQSALLTPILVLLTKLCTHSLTARTTTKSVIFPTIFHPTSSTHLTRAGTAKMDPTDVPCGTFRYYLVGLMTSLDSQLKRCVAELVYVLCDEDADEFTARTGFGNAVALLQLKGLC